MDLPPAATTATTSASPAASEAAPAGATPSCLAISAPAGPAGPFGDEVELDLSGPALRATVDYRVREGVAAHAQLRLPGHRPRQALGLGYGNTVLAELVAAPAGGRGKRLLLTDLTQALPPPARPAPPHAQRLGYGLTDALPTGPSGAVDPTRVVALQLVDLHRSTELLRAEYRPGDQRPAALVVRQRQEPRPGPVRPSAWQVVWLGLEKVWQAGLFGGSVRTGALVQRTLALDLLAPQVLTNAGADDAGRTFVLVDGPSDFDLGPFGETPGVPIDLFATFSAPPGAEADTPPARGRPTLQRRRQTLSAVACAPNGVVAACLDGEVVVYRPGRAAPTITFPVPDVLRDHREVCAVNLQLAAQGQLLGSTRRGECNGTERCHGELFALDFAARRGVAVAFPHDPGVQGAWSSVALAGCDLDAADLAWLTASDAEQADRAGGHRLVTSARRLALGDVPRVVVHGAVAFGNLTQSFRVELDPGAPVGEAARHRACAVVAQTFPTDDAVAAARLDEFNDADGRRLFGAGAWGVVLGFDDMLHLYPRRYAEEDEERDNNLLRGGRAPLRTTETRPWVRARARARNWPLRPNRITLGPFMDRAGRFLFAGLDGNRLQRWDFAPLENGHLAPGKHEPQLQPANERPRTVNFCVTPSSRNSPEAFWGHFGPRSVAFALPPVASPDVDPTPYAAYVQLRAADRPRPPLTLRQVVGYAAEGAGVRADDRRRDATLPALDLPSWGSGRLDNEELGPPLQLAPQPEYFDPHVFGGRGEGEGELPEAPPSVPQQRVRALRQLLGTR